VSLPFAASLLLPFAHPPNDVEPQADGFLATPLAAFHSEGLVSQEDSAAGNYSLKHGCFSEVVLILASAYPDYLGQV
jgi:hypothetical protein